MRSTPRIAVIGAGPGGLSCARILQRHGVDVTVYDRDTSPAARNQGGSLDMHADSGQIALREAGLIDEFLALARPEGQSNRSANRRGEVIVEHVSAPDEDAAPEIDRGQLRALLADSLVPGTIRWGHALATATPLGTGSHRLAFTDGSSTEVDVVIGADGAWSRVRPLVGDATPRYSGVTFVEAHFDDVDRRHPVVAELVGDGLLFSAADNKGLIGQRNSGQHVRAYLAMRTDLHWYEAAGVDLADTEAVRDALRTVFDGWDARLLHLVTDNDGPYVNRPLYVLPTPHVWTHTAGVTLLGDAAHLMSPLGGMGANLAMLDGAELARAIAGARDVDQGIAEYERVMFPRSVAAATDANEALDGVFSDGERLAEDVPDFAEESARHKRAAAGY